MGHGGGGKLMSDLITHLFAQDLKNELLDQMGDSTILPSDLAAGRLAIHYSFLAGILVSSLSTEQ